MTNDEIRTQFKHLQQQLKLIKEAHKHNSELVEQLKQAYEAKIDKILDGIEEIALNFEGVSDPDADEAREHLYELIERIKEGY